ncbi:MAG: FAD:protein FMN transferase [Actinomycetales bacterium]|nr:FAD:protein FMN transferase [Actinomycetales bacterium]
MTPAPARHLEHRFTAMATPVVLRLLDPAPAAPDALAAAVEAIHRVDTTCSRFRDDSDLSAVNRDPGAWHPVAPEFSAAVATAEIAHELTGGLVDPRILDDLERLGYDVDWSLVLPDGDAPVAPRGVLHRRRPPFRAEHAPGRVRLDGCRIDLGGVAKGLAVQTAARLLAPSAAGGLVEAGGDLAVVGDGPDDGLWNVAVEDPLARGLDGDAVAVLAVRDRGVTTSSVRHRSWRRAGRRVHHLIDPRTGEPGGAGLAAVTVVHPDAALAEAWSKALFLTGADGIAGAARAAEIAALWVGADGALGASEEIRPHLLWSRDVVAA